MELRKELSKTNVFSMKTTSHWICGMVGLVSGGIAYINIPGFLQGRLLDTGLSEFFLKAGEIFWAVVVAGVTTLSGLATKYWWDIKGKRVFARWFRKKKKH